MFTRWHMEKAPAMIEKAAAQGETRLLFCICLQSELTPEFDVKNFGLARNDPADGYKVKLYPMNKDVGTELRHHLDLAFAKAAEKRIAVSVLLHLNSIGEINEWRQHFSFDPTKEIAGWSYENALVLPVVETMEKYATDKTPVDFSLQGEMGATIFEYPAAWKELLLRLKQRPQLKHVRWGLSFNHTSVYLGKKPVQIEPMKALWDSCDFIGVSMYKGVSNPPRADDFAMNLGTFVGEFEAMKCPLPRQKPICLIEVGLGGGGQSSTDWKFSVPAKTMTDALNAPFYGTSEVDKNPWKDESLRKARLLYYRSLCDYLRNPNPRWPVPRAYLWSNGSWDVTGIETSDFEDPEIRREILQHNQQCK